MQNSSNIDIMKSYIEAIEKEGKVSVNTIEVYKKEINEFAEYIYPENLLNINSLKIMKYIEKLSEKYSSRTIKRKLISLNGLYKYFFKTEKILLNPLEEIKFKVQIEEERVNIEKGEIKSLLDCCEETPKGFRDKLLINLLMKSGVKINDLINIKLKDIIGFQEINILKKNGRIAISLDESGKELLEKYILEMRDKIDEPKGEYLFKNLSRQNFRARFIKYSKLAGIEAAVSPNEVKNLSNVSKSAEKLERETFLEKIREKYIEIGIGDD